MAIEFTQYLLPNGRQKKIEIDMPEDIETKARSLQEKDCYFDAEVLTTGLVSFTCMKNGYQDDDCVSIELSENGPAVLDAVSNLINTAYERVCAG